MYLRDVTFSLLRRWPIVLIGFLLTAGFCVGIGYVVPASYAARTSMVLLPPSTVVGKGGNPFLFLGGLSQALDVLSRKLSAQSLSDQVKKQYPHSSFTVSADTSTTGPILLVEATARTARSARAVMDEVVGDTAPALESLQANLKVPAASRIKVTELAVDQEPKADTKSRIQAIAATGAVGFVLTLILAVYIDGRLLARRERQDAPSTDPTEGGPPQRGGGGSRRSRAPTILDPERAEGRPTDAKA